MDKRKIVVIGSGPGGYVAAIRAAQLGADVTVIEKSFVGGVCLNWGCMPTKSLLYSANALETVKKAAELGIDVGEFSPNLEKIEKRKNEAVLKLRKGVEYLLKKNGVKLVQAEAELSRAGKVSIKKTDGSADEISYDKLIIATGSVPAMPPVFKYDGKTVITSNEALSVREMPEKLLIVGAGAIGLEFACIYNALGSKVVIVEMMDQILPGEDREIAGVLQKSLEKRGIEIITKDSVKTLSSIEKGVSAVLDSGRELSAGICLVAAGRVPSVGAIKLDSIAFDDKGFIKVDEKMQTSQEGVYAIGDAAGGWLLAHKASAEAFVAAENACGLDVIMNYASVAKCVYTFPEAASVGLTQAGAESLGREVKTGKFPFSALGKAVVNDETEGLVKFVADAQTHEILGVQIVGAHATELISEISLAIGMEAITEDVASAVHPHPTLSESLMEAARAVLGFAVHG